MNEMPQMLSSSYASSTVAGDAFLSGILGIDHKAENQRRFNAAIQNQVQQPAVQLQEKKPMANTTRVIKIFVADADENIDLDKRLLFTSDEKLTDCTDQELFFEVPINELLTKHNEYRKTVADKKASEKFGREVKLEPVRIRDLKMTVVTIASF